VISIIPHEENNIDLQLELLADLTHDPNPDRFDGVPPIYEPEKVMVASLGSIRGLLVQSVVGQTGEDQKIYYFINDHLGTPQKLLNENADVVWNADYKPFGEADVNVNTFENRFRLPGQYFDDETGLHYNYYRYYDPNLGRYLNVDPIGLYGGINLFAYVLNDPINIVDPLGLWPTGIHNKIIRKAFSSSPSPARVAIERGSKYADSLKFQSPKYGYMHSMRMSNQTVEETEKLMNDYINKHLKEYKDQVKEGNCDKAYFHLGMALHPVMDSTSPTHSGFQIWDGIMVTPGYKIVQHILGERTISRTQINRTVQLINQTLKSNGIKF